MGLFTTMKHFLFFLLSIVCKHLGTGETSCWSSERGKLPYSCLTQLLLLSSPVGQLCQISCFSKCLQLVKRCRNSSSIQFSTVLLKYVLITIWKVLPRQCGVHSVHVSQKEVEFSVRLTTLPPSILNEFCRKRDGCIHGSSSSLSA